MKCWNPIIFAVIFVTIALVLLAGALLLYYFLFYDNESCKYDFINQNVDYDEEPLFLTQYILRGEFRKGRELAAVKNWEGVDSFSGYLTVNETYNSNLFFWFFPHNEKRKPGDSQQAPLILYLQGGPGISSMFGLFLETGPFHIDEKFGFHLRNYSWTKTHSMLYIDNPVGTGFSFTDHFEGYAKEQSDVSRDLYEALRQFFTLFSEFGSADFYIAGTSYAGKYIPILAYKIHLENLKSLFPINLKGIAIGSGYFDSILQDEFSNYYYHLGLLDGKQRKIYQNEERRIKVLVENEQYLEARDAIANLFQSMRENYTGFNDVLIHNALEPHTPMELTSFEHFLNKSCIRSALHTGKKPFSLVSFEAYVHFLPEAFFYSTKKELEKLLNANYKVLMYASQLDTIIIHTSMSKFLRSLQWFGGDTYRTIEREIWRVDGKIAGYVKQTGDFVHVLLLNSGHIACFEQSAWCLDMINKFTSGTSFRYKSSEYENSF